MENRDPPPSREARRLARATGADGILVLEAVGRPFEGIATIIAVDRVVDMMRTATNV